MLIIFKYTSEWKGGEVTHCGEVTLGPSCSYCLTIGNLSWCPVLTGIRLNIFLKCECRGPPPRHS